MIELFDVHKVFRRGTEPVRALRGVSFTVRKGESAFIVGPSGSGKSTLLHLLGALDRPDSGTLRVGGTDLAGMSEHDRDEYRLRRVGFVFQSFRLLGNLSALENVTVPLFPLGQPARWRRKASELLDRLGLGDRLHHRPAQLSGGQQQRVAIARAVLKDPVLVLADEPTGELDSRSGEETLGLLRELQAERGATLVIVTHDRRLIREGDLVVELEDGCVRGALSGWSGDPPQRMRVAS